MVKRNSMERIQRKRNKIYITSPLVIFLVQFDLTKFYICIIMLIVLVKGGGKLVTFLGEEKIKSIMKAVEKARTSGNKEFYIDFGGGKLELIKDIKSLKISPGSTTFDKGRSVYTKYIIGIFVEDKDKDKDREIIKFA